MPCMLELKRKFTEVVSRLVRIETSAKECPLNSHVNEVKQKTNSGEYI